MCFFFSGAPAAWGVCVFRVRVVVVGVVVDSPVDSPVIFGCSVACDWRCMFGAEAMFWRGRSVYSMQTRSSR